jgi:hypothetical protein
VSAVSSETVHGSSHYYLFGYPEDAAYEIVRDDRAQVRPDLVYSEGHVRRRIAGVPLPKIRGTVFLELSGVAGGGCSGSPVFKTRSPFEIRRPWLLTGVYVGERITDRATSVGYAVPSDEISSWAPDLLGRTLQQEAADVPEPHPDTAEVPEADTT